MKNFISKFIIIKCRFHILLVVLLFLLFIPKQVYSVSKVKNIIIFFSLNESVPAYQSLLEGFHTTFPQNYDGHYNLIIEYLDVGRSQNYDNAKHIVKLYNEKLFGTKLDLIITVGPGTYPLLKKIGLQALKATPTIEVDLNNLPIDHQYEIEKENVFEIKLKLDIGKSLKNIFGLIPENKHEYIISGSSSVDMYYVNLTRHAAQSFEGKYKFIYISGISLDSTLQIVKKIPANSIAVIPSYMTDVNNAPISTTFALNNIFNQCNAPVFKVSDNFMKKGRMGGCVFIFI